MYFCYFVIISPWKRRGPSFQETWIPFTQNYPCQCIISFSLSSPLEKRWGPSLEQTWVLITKGCIVPSLVKICPVVLEKKIISSIYFLYFIIISPWKRIWPFIWTNLKPLHPRVHCAKVGWNWPSGSGEEIFFHFVNVFSLFRNYLPVEKGVAFYLNKLETPPPPNWSMLCAKFGWNWPSGSREEHENVKSLQTDGRTDDGQKLTWVFSSGELIICRSSENIYSSLEATSWSFDSWLLYESQFPIWRINGTELFVTNKSLHRI